MEPAYFRDCLQFLKSAPSRKLHVGGGEPTLHPEFIEMSGQAIAEGFSIFVYSNGLIDNRVLDFIANDGESFSFLINLNSRSAYSSVQWATVMRSVKVLSEACSVYLGVNIWNPTLDLSHHARVAEEFRLQGIRASLSNPSMVSLNAAVSNDHRSDFSRYGRLLAFLDAVARRCSIPLLMDCGLAPCFFDTHDSGGFDRSSVDDGEFLWGCPPSVPVIGTDLVVRHCFLTVGDWRHVTSFADHNEMLEYVAEEVRRLKTCFPTKGNCAACPMDERCGGACLMGKVREAGQGRPKRCGDPFRGFDPARG